FRDDAFWQPKLLTDASGNVSFTVTFPDDITNWKTQVIAMGDKKQTGYYQTNIKSFKALSGNIVLPQFSIEGDSINVIGKTLNYLPDSVRVKRSFSVNDQLVKENIVTVRNALIDTFMVVGAGKDSLKIKYTIQQENGYADGEERSIPIFKPGTLETIGMFASLTSDTTFEVTPRNDRATMKVYAESSLLPVWYSEAESIRNYEYLCNEQLASKLKAILVQKRIDEYYKRPFKGEKNILDLISRLNQSKSKSGLWDWWRGDNYTMWISLHVIEALTEASVEGYKVDINKTWLTDYLVFNLENHGSNDKISSLFLLHLLGAKAEYKRYIDSIETKPGLLNQYAKLRLIELKQKVGLPVTIDSLIAKKQQTMFGNVYWGRDSYLFFENSIQITLSMYRILRNAGGHEDLLRRTRNYFLEKRKDGNWRNTYESSLILETILPDLLKEDSTSGPTSLTITGKENLTVQQFPFSTELKSGEKINVTKRGALPVYFTAYEQYWNKSPEKLDGNFTVHSAFESNLQTVSKLKAGTPVKLRVTVYAKADAEYVMVEVPIPAGCSYYDKSQSWANNEVHREHFKNKVSIFCRSLGTGRHEFTISLLPRFTGVYTLNPAKAEMMYFPVFVGREGLKRVRIE
ncbi:MAG TPA: alpha-2-macroglobulin family protein, partial [Chitinophagaceae bacterium]